MKRLQISQKLVFEKFYVHEITAVNLSKIYFQKNAKKTCKPNNRDLIALCNIIRKIFSTNCNGKFYHMVSCFSEHRIAILSHSFPVLFVLMGNSDIP